MIKCDKQHQMNDKEMESVVKSGSDEWSLSPYNECSSLLNTRFFFYHAAY